MMETPRPAVIFVISGKRKSGKDYVTDKLRERLGAATCEIMRLSAPLKREYAREHGLDFDRLLDASDYKEQVRVDMIAWGESKRNVDPGFFCRASTLESPGVHKPVWIISDARRITDVEYFKREYPEVSLTVRVSASLATRAERGWMFTSGVDDAQSECGLDAGVMFDIHIVNDGDNEVLSKGLDTLVDIAVQRLERWQSR